MQPRTLEERLQANEYYDLVADLEADRRNRDHQYVRVTNFEGEEGKANRAFLNALDAEIETNEKIAKDLYDSTVGLLDARNDMEFNYELIIEKVKLGLEAETDPAQIKTMQDFLDQFDLSD